MNKITKASIATAAGVILLLGGGGTFASWNDSATAGAGATITAGNLEIIADQPGAWSVNGNAINIKTYAIAPGDVLTYTKPMTIVADGDSMRGTVGLTPTSILPATSSAADKALAADLLTSATLTAEGIGTMSAGQTFETRAPIGEKGINQQITITVTITFPKTSDNDAMTGAVRLDDFTVAITQKV